MSADPVSVVIGGVTYLCPQMPFYCLERAWPHIQAMSQAAEGEFIVQTRNALSIIAAALALEPSPPSYDDLAKRMMASEIAGIHTACAELMSISGLATRDVSAGEAYATSQMPDHLNGTGSSLN